MKNPFSQFEPFGKLKSDSLEYQHPVEELPLTGAEEDTPERPGFWVFKAFIGLTLVVFVGRLLYLQVSESHASRVLAEGNRIRALRLSAPRGAIVDRRGERLVTNVAGFRLVAYPADLPKTSINRAALFNEVRRYAQLDEQLTSVLIAEAPRSFEPIILKENLSREEALLLSAHASRFAGVAVEAIPKRDYNTTLGLSHLLGYVGKLTADDIKEHPEYPRTAEIGRTGLERQYDELLRGRDGIERIEVDAQNKPQRVLSSDPPLPGATLVTTLDLELQRKMAAVLEQKLQEFGAKSAVAVALDPQTSGVLAMVSLPSYDNNIFVRGLTNEAYERVQNDPLEPLLSRATGGTFPSGSTIKPLVAAIGLDAGVVNERTTIDAPLTIEIGQSVFLDWKYHGLTDVRKAIAESVNPFFYAVGGGWGPIDGLGANRLADGLRQFGLGKKTGIDLPSEAAGLVPDPAWKKKAKNENWYTGDTYHMAIGQGDVLVTPLQLAQALAAVANGGKLFTPHLLQKVIALDSAVLQEYAEKPKNEQVVNAAAIQVVREGMRQAVTRGTARQLQDLPIPAAGKTGSAQFGDKDKLHSWFESFAPYDNPQIALVVLFEEAGEGHAVAEPAAKEILQYYFSR